MPDLSVRRVLSVAWREFRYTALTKGFIIAAIGVPLLMVAVLAVVPAAMVTLHGSANGGRKTRMQHPDQHRVHRVHRTALTRLTMC